MAQYILFNAHCFLAVTVVFESTDAGAANWHGDALGEYVQCMEQCTETENNGHIIFKQRQSSTETKALEGYYLYVADNSWKVSWKLRGKVDWLRNKNVAKLPPRTGWEYATGDIDNPVMKDDDATLALKYTSLDPCQLVLVEGGEVVRGFHGNKMGNFSLLENTWSRGRPVYQLVDSHLKMYLAIKEGFVHWTISASFSEPESKFNMLHSPKTTNYPTDVEAAGSDRDEEIMWSFYVSTDDDNMEMKVDVSVKCLD